jgi:ribosome maturation factor RimP
MSVDALLAPIRDHIAGLGFELVDLRRVGTLERPILQVRVDRPDSRPGQGITADDCAGISRSLERFLESSAMVGPRYVLEVSSPGIERPLFTPAQFARFTGETAKVTLKLPQDGRRRLQGAIAAVIGDTITFDVDGTAYAVGTDNIEKARLVPDWAALGLAPAVDKSGRDARPGKQKHPTKKPTAKPSRAE